MDFAHLKQSLSSVVAIPVTPFEADSRVDFAAYRRLIGRLVEGGISVVTPNGNTGEFYSLSPDECRGVLEAALQASGGQAVVMASVGFDVATAIEMARFARQAGAGALMVHQIIHPYRSAEGWIAYHQAIADAVPELGIVPYVRDSLVTPAMMRGLLDACPNVVGVKYAVPDPPLFASMVQAVGFERLAWICGIAESWAPFFWVGGSRGFTSGVVNVQPRLSLDMLHCLRAGDYAGAMRVWAQLKPFEDLRARHNGGNSVSAIKEAMAQMGWCGRTVRPPISELPESERAEVAAILSTWDIRQPAMR